MRRLALTVICLGCAAPPVYVTTDGGADAAFDRELVVESWNVLPFVRTDPIHPALLKGVIDHLATDSSDVVCVSNLRYDADAVVEAVKANYPFHAYRAVDPTMGFDDARDANGDLPELPTTPPCSAGDEAEVAAEIDCISACAGGRETYELSCGSKCFGTTLAPRCLACINVSSAELAPKELRSDCFTRANAEIPSKPRADAVLFSKRPLANVHHHLFPGWLNAAPAVEATVSALGRDLTVFCATVNGSGEPYGGVYGAPFPAGNMSSGEVVLQTRRIADLVFAHGGETIALGSLPTGWNVSRSGPNESDSLWWLVEANLVPLVSPASKLECLFCSTNPLRRYFGYPIGNNVTSHVLATREASLRATSIERTATETTVSFEGASFPPSAIFGVRAVLEPLAGQGAD